jgi:hypothetical protein
MILVKLLDTGWSKLNTLGLPTVTRTGSGSRGRIESAGIKPRNPARRNCKGMLMQAF